MLFLPFDVKYQSPSHQTTHCKQAMLLRLLDHICWHGRIIIFLNTSYYVKLAIFDSNNISISCFTRNAIFSRSKVNLNNCYMNIIKKTVFLLNTFFFVLTEKVNRNFYYIWKSCHNWQVISIFSISFSIPSKCA